MNSCKYPSYSGDSRTFGALRIMFSGRVFMSPFLPRADYYCMCSEQVEETALYYTLTARISHNECVLIVCVAYEDGASGRYPSTPGTNSPTFPGGNSGASSQLIEGDRKGVLS